MTPNQKKLLDLYMDNPCLSNELDYKPDKVRLREYTKHILSLTDAETLAELNVMMESVGI